MDERPTELMPGGGKPAKAVDGDPGEGAGTLPMPKPGPRPDDPTNDMGRKGAGASGGAEGDGAAAAAEGADAAAAMEDDRAPAAAESADRRPERAERVEGPPSDARDSSTPALRASAQNDDGASMGGGSPSVISTGASAASGVEKSTYDPDGDSSTPALRASAQNDGEAAAGYAAAVGPEAAAGHAAAVGPEAAAEAAPAWWRKLPWRTIAIVVAVACVAVAIAAATYAAELWGGRSIPNVAGLAAADAEAQLRAYGFEAEQREQPADEGVGTVVSTEPEAGVRAASGSTVTMLVASPRVVPEVEGSQLAEARVALGDAGIIKLRLEYKNSDEEEGTVIGVSPAAGTVVTADDEVVLQVAQAYRVPSVVGLSQDEATKAIAEAGLYSTIEWRESAGDSLTVLEASPASGEKVASGSTVTLTVVAPGPQGETCLAEYLSSAPQELAQYLPWKGWSFRYGAEIADATAGGASYAEEGWTKSGVGTLVLTPTPESSGHGSFLGEFLTSDVLASGAGVAGVRFEPTLSGDDASPSVDSATVNAWASRCGLTGLKETLSGDDVAERMSGGASSGGTAGSAGSGGSGGNSSGGGAAGSSSAGGSSRGGASGGAAGSAVSSLLGGATSTESITGYGEMGGYVWAVRVTGGSVVVICADASLYDGVDLGGYDNSLAVYLAYSLGR